MSKDIMSFGVMALLASPLTTKTEREIVMNLLDNDGSILKINYEGTIVYSDHYDARDDNYGIKILNEDLVRRFHDELQKYKLNIIFHYSRPYHCLWYNGSDSDMSILKREQFKDLVDAQ
jgi:hypothetical protein